MYDTHCHLNFQAFKKDYKIVTQKSLDEGMMLNIVGTQYDTSKRAVEIAQEFNDKPVYAAVGIHPTHLNKEDSLHKWNYEKYKQLAGDPKVVAIGETGIDRFRGDETLRVQKQIFKEHIRLAKELDKPLVIHCRPSDKSTDAYDDLLTILSNYKLQTTNYKLNGVVHCFIGNWEVAKQLLDIGLFISFTGIITFKNADTRLLEAVKKIPLERVLVETDAPYLTPEPFRGKTRCEPLHVRYVAEKIAEIKKIPTEVVIKSTAENGKQLFLNGF